MRSDEMDSEGIWYESSDDGHDQQRRDGVYTDLEWFGTESGGHD